MTAEKSRDRVLHPETNQALVELRRPWHRQIGNFPNFQRPIQTEALHYNHLIPWLQIHSRPCVVRSCQEIHSQICPAQSIQQHVVFLKLWRWMLHQWIVCWSCLLDDSAKASEAEIAPHALSSNRHTRACSSDRHYSLPAGRSIATMEQGVSNTYEDTASCTSRVTPFLNDNAYKLSGEAERHCSASDSGHSPWQNCLWYIAASRTWRAER